ncbi:sulfite exporter TauE/SafE family protein, partial [bacterium]|nr:sulfite exporter TauE/SafE family protein [bacterium]
MTHNYRVTRYPILVGAIIVWAGWLTLMITGDRWHLFMTKWFMSITMVFGSFIAGATSEGGGAVAFPVMTLLFKIKPHIARDFSLLIQSVGMMAAAFTIFCLRVPVEWRAVLYAGLGGAVGVAIGIDLISPLLPAAFAKIFFTSTWLSFAVALFLINRYRRREVLSSIPNFSRKHAAQLFGLGIVGGTVSGITGSGLDIITFSLLVLSFRLSEKVATPTSVVLMGMNALVGFIWKQG